MRYRSTILSMFVSFLFLNAAQASFDGKYEEENDKKIKTSISASCSHIEIPVAVLQECLKDFCDPFDVKTIQYSGHVFSLFAEVKDERSYSVFLGKDASRKALFCPYMFEKNKESSVWFYRGAWSLTFYISSQVLNNSSHPICLEEDFSNRKQPIENKKEYTLRPGAQIQIPLSLLRDFLESGQNNLINIGVRGFVLSIEGNPSIQDFDDIYRNRMHRSALFYPSYDREKAEKGSWYCVATSSLYFHINKENI